MSTQADQKQEAEGVEEPQKKSPRQHRGMTHRHAIFCQAYSLTGNAASSALEAGYKDKCAKRQGYRLLQRPDISQEVERLKNERGEELKKNRILKVNALRDKDTWLANVIEVCEAINDPSSPQKLKSLEVIGKSLGHLDASIKLNLFEVDNRTFNNHLEITTEALKIAEKLKLLKSITESSPKESPQVIDIKEVSCQK